MSAGTAIDESNLIRSMSPIVSAEIFEIEASFGRPYALSYGTLAKTRAILLKLVDADGIIGWGEANPLQPFTTESPQEARAVLRDILMPAVMREKSPEPGQIDLLLDDLLDNQLCAKGAVSMALLDLLGKRLGVPVATLLGGAVRTTLPVLWPLGSGAAEDDIAIMDEKASEGFSSFMLKMGAVPARDEIARVTAVTTRYGSRFKLIADANQGWQFDEARDFLAGVEHLPLAFVEQPLPKSDFDGMARLALSTSLPISADESLTGLSEAAQLAARRAAAIFSIKSSKNGGPLRAQRIATVARAFGIGCYMNSMLEFGITQAASLQHAVTIPNLVDAGHAFMSTLRLSEDPTDFSSHVRGGTVTLPAGSGLGITVDEAHVRRLAVANDLVSSNR